LPEPDKIVGQIKSGLTEVYCIYCNIAFTIVIEFLQKYNLHKRQRPTIYISGIMNKKCYRTTMSTAYMFDGI